MTLAISWRWLCTPQNCTLPAIVWGYFWGWLHFGVPLHNTAGCGHVIINIIIIYNIIIILYIICYYYSMNKYIISIHRIKFKELWLILCLGLLKSGFDTSICLFPSATEWRELLRSHSHGWQGHKMEELGFWITKYTKLPPNSEFTWDLKWKRNKVTLYPTTETQKGSWSGGQCFPH